MQREKEVEHNDRVIIAKISHAEEREKKVVNDRIRIAEMSHAQVR